MRIDRRVSELKFEQQVTRLLAQDQLLKKRGILVLKIEYPVVEAIFLPTAPLKLVQVVAAMPVGKVPPGVELPANLPKKAKVKLEFQQPLPFFTSRPFGVRIGMDDFDQRAPSALFCDPVTWEPLETLHVGSEVDTKGSISRVTIDRHPTFKRPFLCMRGIREYHEHPQHTGDDWMQYRNDFGLFSTLDTIWRTCVNNAKPLVLVMNHSALSSVQAGWAAVGAK